MYRSINQLSQAKVMKKNAIFTFFVFVAIMFYLILTISHKENEAISSQSSYSLHAQTP